MKKICLFVLMAWSGLLLLTAQAQNPYYTKAEADARFAAMNHLTRASTIQTGLLPPARLGLNYVPGDSLLGVRVQYEGGLAFKPTAAAWMHAVSEWGARPTAADQKAALQRAINSDAEVVYFGPGDYLVSGKINFQPTTKWVSLTPGRTRIVAMPGYTDGQVLYLAGCTSCLLEGIEVVGPRQYQGWNTATDGSKANILVANSSGVTLRNTGSSKAAGFGIWAYNSNLTTLGVYGTDNLSDLYYDGGGQATDNRLILRGGDFRHTIGTPSVYGVMGINAMGMQVKDVNVYRIGKTKWTSGSGAPTGSGTPPPYNGVEGNGFYFTLSTDGEVASNKVIDPYWSGIVLGAGATFYKVHHNHFESNIMMAAWNEQVGNTDNYFHHNELVNGGFSTGDAGGARTRFNDNQVITSGTVTAYDAYGAHFGTFATNSEAIGNTLLNTATVGSGFVRQGLSVFGHVAATDAFVAERNLIKGYDNAMYFNNDGGVGTLANHCLVNNDLQGNTSGIVLGGSVIFDQKSLVVNNLGSTFEQRPHLKFVNTVTLPADSTWISLGVTGTNLPTGLYNFEVTMNPGPLGSGVYQARIGGVLAWVDATNNVETSEVPVAVSAYALNGASFRMRIRRYTSATPPRLELRLGGTVLGGTIASVPVTLRFIRIL